MIFFPGNKCGLNRCYIRKRIKGWRFADLRNIGIGDNNNPKESIKKYRGSHGVGIKRDYGA